MVNIDATTLINVHASKLPDFTPSDVIGRIMTFYMRIEEALERIKIGEFQAR